MLARCYLEVAWRLFFGRQVREVDRAELLYRLALHPLPRLTPLRVWLFSRARARFENCGERFAVAGIDRYLLRYGRHHGLLAAETRELTSTAVAGVTTRYRRLGDVVGEADSLREDANAEYEAANVLRDRLKLASAEKKAQESLRISRAIKHPPGQAKALELLARIQAARGKRDRVSILAQRSLCAYGQLDAPLGLRIARCLRLKWRVRAPCLFHFEHGSRDGAPGGGYTMT